MVRSFKGKKASRERKESDTPDLVGYHAAVMGKQGWVTGPFPELDVRIVPRLSVGTQVKEPCSAA